MNFGKRLRGLFAESLILSFLLGGVTKLYRALRNGFFGKLFTSYTTWNETFQNGFFFHAFGRLFGQIGLKRGIATQFENSAWIRFWHSVCEYLLCCRLKVYGALLASMGVYMEIVYLIKRYFLSASIGSDLFYSGIVLILLSGFLMMSSKTLHESLGDSRVMSFLIFDVMGISREHFEDLRAVKKRRYNAAVILGMVLGALTYVVPPAYYAWVALGILVVWVIFCIPELGVVAMVTLLPFFELFAHSTLWLALLILLTAASYLAKLLRGKRVVRFELFDAVVILFMGTIFFGGAVSAGGIGSFASALLCCVLMLGYFLTVNLLRTPAWIRLAVIAGVLSAFLVALYGCFQYFFTSLTPQWLDLSMFSDIAGRVTSVFDNPNYLATYLVLIFPPVVALLTLQREVKSKILCVLICVATGLCLVLTWSRGAWLAFLLSMILFFLLYSRKTLIVMLFSLPLIPLLVSVLPSNVVNRFASIGNLADSSTLYRVYTWRGTGQMLGKYFFSGIGYGESAFAQVYPTYAYAGIESAMHSHNLVLQLLSDVGLVGLIIFVLLLILFAQNSLEYMKKAEDPFGARMVCAGLCSIFGAILIGVTDYIWYNNKIFFLFWLTIGLVGACIRTGRRYQSNIGDTEKNNQYRASIEIRSEND